MQFHSMEKSNANLSLIKGLSQPELWQLTLGSLIDRQAVLFGDRPALLVNWQSARLSYRQLGERSLIVAGALYKFGLRHGDCVGVLGGNRVEYIETFLGAARLGCPVVVLNSLYTPHELHNALRTTGEILLHNSSPLFT
jgi:mevalonyl-CoA ligase